MAILSSCSVGRGGEGDERCMLHVRHESGGEVRVMCEGSEGDVRGVRVM